MNASPDTLAIAKRLEAAGLDRAVAEAVTAAIAEGTRDMTTDELTTKADLEAVKSDLANHTAELTWAIYVSSLATIALLFVLLRFTG